ncbi:TIGR03757 family integrating conjugative element protein [Pseudomonas sp. KFB-139]|uniref:TIGR03757 family integrating conjugative element protein n=1 Tax=Pseudomonas serbiensis TaxID=3064350 RepID=A0ABT9CVA4_9PSED|nr:TIGR03757 family integrating conjugative element protein [Pseudomonas sp. KFB-138]MDO7927755.1 TIGR03757 family integrating conjugative element protein [Pseudomonas sp. KFB-138]
MAPMLAFADIWVITDSHHPIQTRPGARVILLDDTQRLQEKLSDGLPADPQQAMAIVKQRMQSKDGQRLQKELVDAQQGVADSWSLGITKLPAVVVDRKYVIYGEPDVDAAERRIARYRESNQ